MIQDLIMNASTKVLIDNIDATYPASAQREDGSLIAPGFMGVFMNGLFQEYDQQGTFIFTVPSGVTKLRVRTVGRGNVANHNPGYWTAYGAAGGYAHGVFDVTPGEQFTVNVPSYRYNALTEASFGNAARGTLIRATNGGAYNAPGTGYGGDYQSTGGKTGSSNNGTPSGFGAAATQISKVGGNGVLSAYSNATAGGGVGGNASTNGNVGQPGGAGGNATSTSLGPGVSLNGLVLPPGFPRFKFDGFWGAGNSGLPGGGSSNGSMPGLGGGLDDASSPSEGTVIYGAAPNMVFSVNKYNGGTMDARGLVVIEW